MLINRSYVITDEGDEFQLQLIEGGVQVGGALFPDDGQGGAFSAAYEVAQGWAKDSQQ